MEEFNDFLEQAAAGGNPGGCLFLGGEIVVCEMKFIN